MAKHGGTQHVGSNKPMSTAAWTADGRLTTKQRKAENRGGSADGGKGLGAKKAAAKKGSGGRKRGR